MPRDGDYDDIKAWDPDKAKEREREVPRMPSPFAKYFNKEEEGFRVVEVDVPSVGGEQRRLLLQEMIPRLLGHAKVPDCAVVEPLRYVEIY